jgi:hypothetical protein
VLEEVQVNRRRRRRPRYLAHKPLVNSRLHLQVPQVQGQVKNAFLITVVTWEKAV